MSWFAGPRGRSLPVAFALAITAASFGAASIANAAPANQMLIATAPTAPLKDLGRLAPTATIHIALVLNYRNAQALDAYIAQASDPTSKMYGRFLTPAQFEANFAPSPAAYGRVAATLAASGFALEPSPTRSLVNASAPAAVVERFFSTRLDAVAQPNVSGRRFANVLPAALPRSLGELTFGVAGLDNLIVAHPHSLRGIRAASAELGPPLQGPDAGLAPYAFARAYDFPVLHANPAGGVYDGRGHAAGVVIDSDLGAPGDLANFLAYFGIQQTGPALKRVLIDGGPKPATNSDGLETDLDLETISGLAPGAATYLYLMPDLSTKSIVDAYSKVVTDDKVDALNSSFGGCELDDNLGELSDHIALQGAAEGITFVASAGDNGASACDSTANELGVSAPANAPHFVAVGGTSLVITTAGTYQLEYAWQDGGGGVSTRFALPSYQSGIKTATARGRNVPDIAFDANPGSGASTYYDNEFFGPIGGTSLASPIFVAFLVERNEVAKSRSGFINPTLYSTWKTSGYGKAYRDITRGNNFYFGVGSGYPGYFAGPGYDDVTGIGSLIGTPNAK